MTETKFTPDANGWMPTPAPVPDDRFAITLFFDPICGRIYGHWLEGDPDGDWGEGWIYQDFAGDYVEGVDPTHWRPLPAPPVKVRSS